MPNPTTDYQLPQSQTDIEDLAGKIQRQSCYPISYHNAYIQAVRLLGQT